MTQTLPINDAAAVSDGSSTFPWERLTVYGAVIASSVLAWVGIWVLAMDHAAVDGGVATLGPGMAIVDEFLVWAGFGAFPPGSVWSEICRAVLAGSTTDSGRWTVDQAALALAMWMVMAVGMMLPTAAPVIATYSDISHAAAAKGLPRASASVFASGCLLVWGALGLGVTLAQWALQGAISDGFAQSTALVESAPLMGAAVLIAAGLYQWSALKEACLSQCRSPMRYFLLHWREGTGGAVRMGMSHGLYCAGCCWALMAVMFVGGTMNLVWMTVLTVIMLLEKIMPKGQVFGRVVGVALALWGFGLVVVSVS
jgi:predicted metal-binding membrane protein